LGLFASCSSFSLEHIYCERAFLICSSHSDPPWDFSPRFTERQRMAAMNLHDRRKCAEPGCETYFIPKSTRNRFCLRHRKTGPVDPEHYLRHGTAHRRLRKQWASKVARGKVVCSRCGELIDPRDRWDLDHVDGGGPLEYDGPSHARCNRATNRRREDCRWDVTSRIW
jgi:hypothetical protein